MKVDKRTSDRLKKSIKRFKPILQGAKERDVNESDTVTIITDLFVELFGYDRYQEITREYAIKGTYCDLAIKIDEKPKILVEVKAIGVSLREDHIRQATNYGVRENIPWVILTNGIDWLVYHIGINNDVKVEKIANFNLIDLDFKKEIDTLFALCREGMKKSAIEKLYEHQSIFNKYCISSIIMSDDLIKSIHKNLKIIAKGVKVTSEDICSIIENEVIKRDIIESEELKTFKKKTKRLKKSPKSPTAPKTENGDTNL